MKKNHTAGYMWDIFYKVHGAIDTEPSRQIVEYVPRLKREGVFHILDAGCGTGRNIIYLQTMGFDVHGIDVSTEAIRIARSTSNETTDYRVGTLTNLPYASGTMDFVFSIHSLEYGKLEDIRKSVREIKRVLKSGGLFFLSADSTMHPFYKINSDDIIEASHIGFSMKSGLPNHFFTKAELENLFNDCKIEELKHVSEGNLDDPISPIREWVLLAYKK